MKRFFIIVAIITFSLSIVKTSLAQGMNGMPPKPEAGQDGGYIVPKAVTCAKSKWLVSQLEKLEENDSTFIGFVSAEPMGSVILHLYKNTEKAPLVLLNLLPTVCLVYSRLDIHQIQSS